MNKFICGFAAGVLTGALAVYIFVKKNYDVVEEPEEEKSQGEELEELLDLGKPMADILDFPTQVVSAGQNVGYSMGDYTKMTDPPIITISPETLNDVHEPVIYGESDEPFHKNVHIEPEEKEHILPDDIFVSRWTLVTDRAMRDELWENSHYYDAFDGYDMFEYEYCQDSGYLYFSNIDGQVLSNGDFELFDPIDFESEFGNCYNLCERIFLSNEKQFIAKITIREEDLHEEYLGGE